MQRITALIIALSTILSMGAQHRTANFVVNAPTPEIARQVGQWAEHYRKEKAIQWVGREMAPWNSPCPLSVDLNPHEPSGETSFTFTAGNVGIIRMIVRGPLERVVNSVLPHEVTHTVFAFHFRQPVPRWADEGGSVLSEDDLERDRHDKLVRSILNRGQGFRLRTLFSMKEYPAGQLVGNLYAQGFSVTDYLVKRSSRPGFLNFVAHGLQQGWDSAAQAFFGHRTVEELEEAWLKHLRDTKRQLPDAQLASNGGGRQRDNALVRLTVPPAQPLDPAPVARGAMPTSYEQGRTFAPSFQRPGYLPEPENLNGTRPVSQGELQWRQQQPAGIPQTPAIQIPSFPTSAVPPGNVGGASGVPFRPMVTLGAPQPPVGQVPFQPSAPVGFPR